MAISSWLFEDTAECKEAYRLSRIPAEDLTAHLLMYGDMSVELDGIRHIQTLNLPRVAKIQPVVRLLMLEAINNVLQREQHQQASIVCRANN